MVDPVSTKAKLNTLVIKLKALKTCGFTADDDVKIINAAAKVINIGCMGIDVESRAR